MAEQPPSDPIRRLIDATRAEVEGLVDIDADWHAFGSLQERPPAGTDSLVDAAPLRDRSGRRWPAVAAAVIVVAAGGLSVVWLRGEDAVEVVAPATTGDEPQPTAVTATNAHETSTTVPPPTAPTSDPMITLATSSSTSTTSSRASPSTSTLAPSTTSVPVVTDTTTFEGSVSVPVGGIGVGPDDLFVTHADGDLWLHPGILGGSPAEPFRIADLGDPRDPVIEGPGPNQVEHVAGVFNGTVIYSDCCEPAAGNVLAAIRADSERIDLFHGYTPKFSPDRTKLAAANSYALNVVELSTGALTGRALNDGSTYMNVWDVAWADDGTLVLLYSDDRAFALLAFDAGSLLAVSSPTQLGVPYDPEAPSNLRFAGHGANGEIALTSADETSTLIRFFDPATLAEIPHQERVLSPGVKSVLLASDGIGLLWVEDEQLWYHPAGGEPRRLGIGYTAAWFAT